MIVLLKKFPVVLTSDRDWDFGGLKHPVRPGRILFLPADAVLIDMDDYEAPEREAKDGEIST